MHPKLFCTAVVLILFFSKCGYAELHQVTQLKNEAFAGSFGHQLAISPDGKLIAVGNYRIGIWDADSGKRLRELDGHIRSWAEGGVSGMVFSADSKSLISCGQDGTVRFWEVATGKLHREVSTNVIWVLKNSVLSAGRMPLHALAYSSKTNMIAAVGHDWTIRLWNSQSGKYLGVLGESKGERLKASEIDPEVLNDDPVQTKEILRMPRYYNDGLPKLCFSPDGKTIAVSESEQTRFWNVPDRKLRLTIPEGGKGQFSPDGMTFVTGKYESLTVWNAKSGEKIRDISNTTKGYAPLQFSPDGAILATGSAGAAGIRLWDFQSGTLKQTIPYGGAALDAIRFFPDGQRIAATVRRNQVYIFDIQSGRKLFGDAHTNMVTRLTFTPQGRYLISGSADSSVKVWDTRTWKLVSTLTQPQMYASALYCLSDSDQVLVGDRHGSSRLLKIPSLDPVLKFSHRQEQDLCSVAGYLLLGDRLFVGIDDTKSLVEIWDWKTQKLTTRLQQHPTYHLKMSAAHDQSIVVTTDYDGNVIVWENEPQNRIAEFHIDGKHISAVAVSPDGKQLATCGRSGAYPNLQIWDTRSQKEMTRLRPGGSGITEIAWSPQGDTLVIASMGKPGLYLFKSGKMTPVNGFRGIHSIAFSPDGKWLAAGNEEGVITIFEILKKN